MSTELDDAKRRVKSRVLGRPGVHAVGLRRLDDQVVVYATVGAANETILAAAREAAAPYEVVVVEGERPVVAMAAAPADVGES